MNIIIITGASSGMGLEFALQLDAIFDTIDEIWLIARRKKDCLKWRSTWTIQQEYLIWI